MQERSISFENDGQKLYGMIHIPDGNPPYPCVVFLHGYTGNRIEDHRLFVKAARSFCAKGMVSLRFDFRGSGESEGNFEDVTIESEISDAIQAVNYVSGLKEVDNQRIGILGFSLGGCVAACISPRVNPRSLALWSPFTLLDYLVEREGVVMKDPYAWLPKTYLVTLKRKGSEDIGGFKRAKAFFESIRKVDPLREIASYNGPVLIIQGSEDEVICPTNAELLYDALIGRRVLLFIDGADHSFSSDLWERQVIETTAIWFKQTL